MKRQGNGEIKSAGRSCEGGGEDSTERSRTYLLEADVVGIFAEASAAQHHVILSDQTMVVSALAAA